METEAIKKARNIFERWKLGWTSQEGIAISDCRTKEIMVITRYGGDVFFVFFDVITEEIKFFFLAEMTWNKRQYWNDILRRFVEIKAKLKQ